MNYIKILYFNIETINADALEGVLRSSSNYTSHISIKPGLILVNYRGTAKQLFDALSSLTSDNNILIYDLDNGSDAYWGYMNKSIWDWIKQNKTNEQ